MIGRIHWPRLILLSSLATLFMHYSIRLGYGILMPEMILSLKIAKASGGNLASSFFLDYGIPSLIMGFMAEGV
jgi:sugar phosphate permease